MDILREFVLDNTLSKESIGRLIDDYSLYCYYIGHELELGKLYSSPLREGDNNPSFGLVSKGSSIIFKDFATGTKGDVFAFVGNLLGLTYKETLIQINSDLELGLEGENVKKRKPRITKSFVEAKSSVAIDITSKPKASKDFYRFWDTFGITHDVLELYEVKEVAIIHYIFENGVKRIFPKTLAISYCMFGYYKIYQPYETKRFKFRTEFTKMFVEGAVQLNEDKRLLIITKSTKECMFFRSHFRLNSIAGVSETTMINPDFMKKRVIGKYKNIIVWLDNDSAGLSMQQEYLKLYPSLIPLMLPNELIEKDPTDLYKFSDDKQSVLHYIKTLIRNGIKKKSPSRRGV